MQSAAPFYDEVLDLVSAIPLLNGKTVKEEVGIKDEDLANLYALACHFYHKGKLNEAEVCFKQLVLFDSTNIEYMLGLGAVLQKKKLFNRAVDIYAAAHMVQINDARPMFYAGQCHFYDRKYSKAKYCFELVIEQNHSAEFVKMAKVFLEAMATTRHQEKSE